MELKEMIMASKEKMQVGSLLTKDIYLQAKAQSALEMRTVGELIDEAILDYLHKVKKSK